MKARLLLVVVVVGALAAGAALWLQSEPVPQPVVHTVVRGDTLSKLARAHGCTVDDLMAWNGLSSDRIDVGQELVVGHALGPASEPAPEAAATPPSRRRRTGESAREATPPPGPMTGGLSLPPEQPCLSGPTLEDDPDEAAFAASAGLDRGQIKGAMDRFLPTLQRCVVGDWPDGTVELSITVACTGRVARVEVRDDGGLDGSFVDCVADTLRYAPFPAHDLPDGETFGYPVRFSR